MNGSNVVYLFSNDGSVAAPFAAGGFGVRVGPTSSASKFVALGDVDRDGDLDIVAGVRGNGERNLLYLNNGTADPFLGVVSIEIDTDGDSTRAVALGDVDQDGDLDLVAGNHLDTDRVYLNDGDADPFSDATVIPILKSGSTPTRSVALGDVDGDGDLDLVAGISGANRLYLNDGSAAPFFSAAPAGIAIGSAVDLTTAVALGDVDGDGDLDLVVGNEFATVNLLYLNDGSNIPYSDANKENIAVDAHDTQSVALDDIDGDGDLDLVVGNSGSPSRLYLNNGTIDPFGDVEAGIELRVDREGEDCDEDGGGTPLFSTRALGLGDVDGNGTIDVMTGNWNNLNGEGSCLYRFQTFDTTRGVATSLVVDTTSNFIKGATLDAPASTPAHTSIDYYLSNDNGSHYFSIQPGHAFAFPTNGNDLRWRAVLRSLSPARTPRIDSLTITELTTVTANPGILLVSEGVAGNGVLGAVDPESDLLTFSIVANGAKGTAVITDAASGAYTYTPSGDENGVDTFTFLANDGGADSNVATVTVTITPVNDPPTIAGEPPTIAASGVAYVFSPTGDDVDGNTLTYSIVNKPGWAGFDPADGTLSGTPGAGDVSTTSGIVISVSDGTLGASLAAFDLTVAADDTPPSAAITAPPDQATLVELFEINGTSADAATGVTLVEVQITDGTNFLKLVDGTQVFSSGCPCWVPATDDSPGGDWSQWTLFPDINWTDGVPYTITVRATDAATLTATDMVTVDFFTGEPAFTTVDLNLSTSSILFAGVVDATLKLTKAGDPGFDLSGSVVRLEVTSPDSVMAELTAVVNSDGQAVLQDVGCDGADPDCDSESALVTFDEKGTWTLRAEFDGSVALAASESEPQLLLAGTSAGYAVIVQGRLPGSAEGLESHNKTANRVYQSFIDRGFAAPNIFYFNYDLFQDVDGDGVVDVDAVPSKAAIQAAIEGLAGLVNFNPAPMYVAMVDHGGIDEKFFIDTEVITAQDLDGWLDTLEAGLDEDGDPLTADAADEARVVILGYCYSGDYVSTVSADGRLVITSAGLGEQSYKGPVEGDGIRVGEYFLEELFQVLVKGETFLAAFVEATDKTEQYTRRGGTGSANSDNPFLDDAVQHPLLDDDGNGLGSNVLGPGVSDGVLAGQLVLGTGPNFDVNSADNPADILAVGETCYLPGDGQPFAQAQGCHVAGSDTSAIVHLVPVDNAQVGAAYVEVREPGAELIDLPTTVTEQRERPSDAVRREALNAPNSPGAPAGLENTWHLEYGGASTVGTFSAPGKYEVYYYVNDNETGAVSPSRRSVVYKDKGSNPAPSAFELIAPITPASDPLQTYPTVGVFDWSDATDEDGNANADGDTVTYTLEIASDVGFTTLVHRQEELTDSVTVVDGSAGLEDLTTYYWRVFVVDGFGARTESTCPAALATGGQCAFSTDNPDALPGFVSGRVYDAKSYQPLFAAVVNYRAFTDGGAEVTGSGTFTHVAGGYRLTVETVGSVEVTAERPGYENLTVAGVSVSANRVTSGVVLLMHPEGSLTDFDGDGQSDDVDLDDDNDGIPDAFEDAQAGLNAMDATDATTDLDGDGFTNLEEFQAGTDIGDANSFPERNRGRTHLPSVFELLLL